MASHSGVYCQNMSGNIYIYQGTSPATLNQGTSPTTQNQGTSPATQNRGTNAATQHQGTNAAKRKRGQQGTSKQNKAKQARKTDVKICYWQDSCRRWKCHFVHLPSRLLSGKKKPYKLCYHFPTAECKREDCQYVHWVEGMAVLPVDQEDRADDNGTISSQSFTSRGVGQRAEDSASDTMHSPRYIDN